MPKANEEKIKIKLSQVWRIRILVNNFSEDGIVNFPYVLLFLFHYRLVLIDFKGNSIIVQLKKVLVYFNVKIGMISILNS